MKRAAWSTLKPSLHAWRLQAIRNTERKGDTAQLLGKLRQELKQAKVWGGHPVGASLLCSWQCD